MLAKRILSVVVLVAMFSMYTTNDLQAAAIQTSTSSHAVSSQELHQAVQASNQQTKANRKSVQDFFARPEVNAQIKRIGVSPEKLASSVSMLSESDLQSLNQQIMSMDQQKATAGLSKGAIWAIVLGGSALLAIVIWLNYRAVDEINDSYY
jgi:hypothetical protein